MKLLIVGLDALDIKYFQASKLPAFKKFREVGQWGSLHTDELWSGPNWTTIFTGLTKERHGVTDSLGRPFDSEWIGSRPRDYIWDILAQNGYTVGVMNFPGCYVARSIAPGSWMVGGWPGRPSVAPNRKLPPDFYSDLPDYSERGPLSARRPKGAQPGWAIHEFGWKEYKLFATENYFAEMAIAAEMPATDILMIQCSILDRAGHMLSTGNKGGNGAADPRYGWALKFAHDFLWNCQTVWQADYTVLVSDHGFRKDKHSHFGTWAIRGPGILNCRNNTEMVNFMPTIVEAVGKSGAIDYDPVWPLEIDGQSVLLADDKEQAEDRLKGLGYV